MFCVMFYPLVNVYMAMENTTITKTGKSTMKWNMFHSFFLYVSWMVSFVMATSSKVTKLHAKRLTAVKVPPCCLFDGMIGVISIKNG